MPNPIKYSTGSESDALKKGNLYIGTGAVGKGPSDTTGYYNGVSPSSGGYTIYMYKSGAPGNLSYHSAANDSQLISFTNNLAGTSYTGIQQCFDYYYGQTDKVLVNQDYPADFPYIVMDGLVCYLDAGITLSYPSSGTTWSDINGLGPKNNGTLVNGPTFSSLGGGSISFDGVDDVGTTSMTVEAPTNSNLQSIGVWLYGNSDGNSFTGTDAAQQGACHLIVNWQTSNQIRFAQTWYGGSGTESTDYATVTSLGWNYMVVVKKAVQTYDVYFNGSKVMSNVIKEANISTQFKFGNWWNGRMCKMTGVAIVQFYNRALSDSEVLQNYNVQKGRFGL